MERKILAILVVSCLWMPVATDAQSIATVVISRGDVVATDVNGTSRALARKSQINEGDTVVVNPDGQVQLRMIDDALIMLLGCSELVFDSYRYDNNPQTPDRAVMTLKQGAARLLSGKVGHGVADIHRLETSMGTIGIKGTTFEVVLLQDELLVGGIYGAVDVTNEFGSVGLGIDSNYEYAHVLRGKAPEVLVLRPALMLNYAGCGKQDPESNTDRVILP